MIWRLIKRFKAAFYPDSLRIQLLSRSLLILAVLLVLIGLVQYFFMRDMTYRNKAASLQSQVMTISPRIWERLSMDPDSGFEGPPLIFIPDTNLAIIDPQGNYSILSRGHGNIEPPRLDMKEYTELLNKRHGPKYTIISDGGAEQLVVLQPIASEPGTGQGVVQISTLTGPLKELLIRQLLAFFLLALAALLIGLLAYLPVIRRTLEPLSNMVDTSEQINAGNLDKRFPVEQGQMEIDRLAQSFNGMLERLEGSFEAERETQEQMRRFIADASHELRTPLTSIHGFLEVLLRGAASQPEQLDKALRSMHSESQRLNKLVHDLLLLSKLDRTQNIELTAGSLDTVISSMEPQLRILAGNRTLNLSIEPDMTCKYDTDQIKQVILNLFQNAVQHTDAQHGVIQILLNKKDSGVQLSIQDNGPGISETHIPYVFDRFYRSDSSRTRKYGGSGLGLSITKSIVDAHEGAIWVESQEGAGSVFNVWLPE